MIARRALSRITFPAVLIVVPTALVAIGQPAAAEETCLGQTATIVGSGVINGTEGNDVIVGSAGVDTIAAGGGNDVVCDGAGSDKVDLGAGDDTEVTHTLKDVRDVFDGGSGTDTVRYLRSKTVKINLRTTTADDGEIGEADKLLGIEGVVGGSGNDTLVGSYDNDFLDGGPGNDTITASLGSDTERGSAGNDVFLEEDAGDPDDIDGGPGTDEVSYASRFARVVIRLDGSGASGETGEGDVISAVENARGGDGNDDIYGSSAANVMYGGDGADAIIDGLGADTADGGNGCDFLVQSATVDPGDVLIGGGGSCDYVDYFDRTSDVTIRLNTTTAVNGAPGENDVVKTAERAYGGSGNDSITGSGSANTLYGQGGSDVIDGLGGNDQIGSQDGIAGNDTVKCGFGSDTAFIDSGDTNTGCETIYPS